MIFSYVVYWLPYIDQSYFLCLVETDGPPPWLGNIELGNI